jgi:hypothetical protein
MSMAIVHHDGEAAFFISTRLMTCPATAAGTSCRCRATRVAVSPAPAHSPSGTTCPVSSSTGTCSRPRVLRQLSTYTAHAARQGGVPREGPCGLGAALDLLSRRRGGPLPPPWRRDRR